jgi:ATP-binding cassette subfamily B protein RaxB
MSWTAGHVPWSKQLPVILSSEAAECGLACIAMIAGFYSDGADINTIRRRFPLSLSGATLRSLMTIADQMGLASRALRTELDGLRSIQLPAILHWDLNHFVVLRSVGRRTVRLHDPARGDLTLSIGDVSNHFTGVAIELTPTAEFQPLRSGAKLRLADLWSTSRGLVASTLQTFVLSAALQLMAFVAAIQIQLVVDGVIGGGMREMLPVLAGAFSALVILQNTTEALRNWIVQIVGNNLGYQVTGNVLHHLFRLPVEYFERRSVGDILARLGSTSAIRDVVCHGIVSAIVDGVMVAIAGVILFFYSSELAAIVAVSVIVVLLIPLLFYSRLRATIDDRLTATGREQSHLMESVRSISTIKVLGRETQRESAWRNLYASVFSANIKISRYQITSTLLQNVVIGLQVVAVIYFGTKTVMIGGPLTIGMLLAFLSFRQTFTDRMVSLTNQVNDLRLLGVYLERLGDVTNTPPEIAVSGAASPANVRGAINVRGVAFRYGMADPYVLTRINLAIEPGEFVAITGVSGCGKTTLLKVLLGLHRPSVGEVILDGVVATPELWRSWRECVGVVAQDDQLLSGTLADNISFFDPDGDMDRVQEASAAARVHDEIMAKPMGYLSLIGDMGSVLSAGQRQRVLLARALYRRPTVLFLDEGTANLDAAAEAQIADLVEQLPMTRVVVAHRPALIERAHRVLTLREGELHPAE